jgi:hypothetical protein
MKPPSMQHRLWWAGWLVALGLAVEVAVSRSVHPLAFIVFAVVACPLVAAGMVLFLWSLISATPS